VSRTPLGCHVQELAELVAFYFEDGMKSAGRRGDGNRTTSSNAWKPPPSEGTTSPQRALRWQASAGGQEKDSPDSPSPDEARSEKSGSTNRTSGTTKSGTQSGTNSQSTSKKKKGKEAVKEDSGDREPDEVDWYGDPLVPGIDASLGPGGSLFSFTAKGKPRPGMCNPPMNPQVRAALMKDLNAYKVAPIVTSKKDKEDKEDNSQKKDTRRRKLAMPTFKARKLTDDDSVGEAVSGESAWNGAATMPAGFGGSAGSSRMSSPAPGLRRSASVTTHAHRGNSPFVRTRRKRGESTWQLDLTQEGKPQHGLDTAPEGEVKWRSHKLRLQSREHGFVLEKMDVKELGHLRISHNVHQRSGPLQHPMPPVHPVIPSRQLRDLQPDLHSTTQSCARNVSDATLRANADLVLSSVGSMGPAPRSTIYNFDPALEAPSMERLMEMANAVKHSGPHKLQSMCQNARISVHTGAKLPDTMDIAGASCYDDDPLYSSRPGATPRTSSGKPLPVPYWGRNGSAPVLREAPEVRQARATAEAAR